MNRLNELPKRFNELKSLEMLDLTYNNLTEVSLGEHFFDDQTPLSKEHIPKSNIYFADMTLICTPISYGGMLNFRFVMWTRPYEFFIYPIMI